MRTHTTSPSQPLDQILGVGCDVVHLPTLRRQVNSAVGPRFLANTFTDVELTRCAGDPRRLAQHWAGKEAVAKAIGSGAGVLVLRQIELHADNAHHKDEYDEVIDADDLSLRERALSGVAAGLMQSGWTVRAAGQLTWPHQAHRWAWTLSIADSTDYVLAVAIASLSAALSPRPDDPQAVEFAQPTPSPHDCPEGVAGDHPTDTERRGGADGTPQRHRD